MHFQQFIPIFEDLTRKYSNLIFWKHFESGLEGQGDIDTIAPPELVNAISSSFVQLSLERIPNVVGIVECRYSENVRPHFIVLREEFPSLFQFDISWQPIRLGVPWCDPAHLVQFSRINELGIRVLQPGALSIVLLMLYGISRKGQCCMKRSDHHDMLYGIRHDLDTALNFVEHVIPHYFRTKLQKLVLELETNDWVPNLTKEIWYDLVKGSVKFHFLSAQFNWFKIFSRLNRNKNSKHHHSRIATQKNIEQYFAEMKQPHHLVSRKALPKTIKVHAC